MRQQREAGGKFGCWWKDIESENSRRPWFARDPTWRPWRFDGNSSPACHPKAAPIFRAVFVRSQQLGQVPGFGQGRPVGEDAAEALAQCCATSPAKVQECCGFRSDSAVGSAAVGLALISCSWEFPAGGPPRRCALMAAMAMRYRQGDSVAEQGFPVGASTTVLTGTKAHWSSSLQVQKPSLSTPPGPRRVGGFHLRIDHNATHPHRPQCGSRMFPHRNQGSDRP